MKLLQHRGPFRSGEEIANIRPDLNVTYVQIGIQFPKAPPLDWRKSLTPDIEVNGTGYVINDPWILEFCDFTFTSFNIIARRDFPEDCIVDILMNERSE